MSGSQPFSLSAADWKKIGVGALLAALGAIGAYFSSDVLPQVEDSDVRIFLGAGLAVLLNIARKFLGDTSGRVLGIVGMLALMVPSAGYAEDVVLKGLAPGEYYLKVIVAADGSISAVPLRSVTLGGIPPTQPPPTDPTNPPPTAPALSLHAKQLTATAIGEGGTHLTAGSLSVVYSVVANQVDSGALALNQIAPALKALTDSVIPANEALAWSGWRFGIGDALTTKLGTKAEAVAALRAVSDGTKSAVNATADRTGKAIDWTALFNLLLPILLRLLEDFLKPAM